MNSKNSKGRVVTVSRADFSTRPAAASDARLLDPISVAVTAVTARELQPASGHTPSRAPIIKTSGRLRGGADSRIYTRYPPRHATGNLQIREVRHSERINWTTP